MRVCVRARGAGGGGREVLKCTVAIIFISRSRDEKSQRCVLTKFAKCCLPYATEVEFKSNKVSQNAHLYGTARSKRSTIRRLFQRSEVILAVL